MVRYIIVGDTEKYRGCLVCTCGGKSKEDADKQLERMRKNPTENDKRIMEGHSNLRVEEVAQKDCWWDEA